MSQLDGINTSSFTIYTADLFPFLLFEQFKQMYVLKSLS